MRTVFTTPSSQIFRLALRLPLAIAALALAGTSSAWEYELLGQAGVDYSDNIDRLPDELKRDELTSTVAGIFRLAHDAQDFDVDVDYVIEQSDYKNDRIETETQVQGASNINWRIYEDNVLWDFRHLITEANLGVRETGTPDTRETRNVYSTGPTFAARLSKVDRLILAANYTVVEQDTANVELTETAVDNARNLDSARTMGRVSWRRQLSSTSALSLSYAQAVTELDDDSPDFEFEQIFASYEVQLASGRYGISLGYNESERDGQDNQQEGTYAAISYLNDFGGRTLEISIVNQLTDSSIGLGADGADVTDSNFGVLDIVERTNARVIYGYDNICRSCQWEISYEYDKEDFQETAEDDGIQLIQNVQDNTAHIIRSLLRYAINSRSTSYFGLGYTRAEFDNDGGSNAREDDRYNARAGLEHQLNDRVDVEVGVNYNTRDTEIEGTDVNRDFDELSGFATITVKLL